MPCYRLVLSKKQTVYNLADLMLLEDSNLPTESGSSAILTSSDTNTADIKVGDEELSGLRYGSVLVPGGSKSWQSASAQPATSMMGDKCVLCEEKDNQEILVELS